MPETTSLDKEKIEFWISHHYDIDKARKELITAYGEEKAEILLKDFKKVYYAKRQKTGFIYLLIGAFTGFISCLLSITNPFPELYEAILYGLTSVALLIIFVGLYYCFE